VLNTAYNLGLLFRTVNQHEKAISMLLGALTGYERVFGLDHEKCADMRRILQELDSKTAESSLRDTGGTSKRNRLLVKLGLRRQPKP